jgi:hypothetical protein
LIKTPWALVSEDAQFALLMPADPPQPGDPAAADAPRGELPVPLFDRRHHYWWTWGEQEISRGGFSDRDVSVTRTETVQDISTQFY